MPTLRVKQDKCPDCGHAKDDHSVYRPICLINGCNCDREGGLSDPTGRTVKRARKLKAVAEQYGTTGVKA